MVNSVFSKVAVCVAFCFAKIKLHHGRYLRTISVFRTLSYIWGGTFCKNNQRLLTSWNLGQKKKRRFGIVFLHHQWNKTRLLSAYSESFSRFTAVKELIKTYHVTEMVNLTKIHKMLGIKGKCPIWLLEIKILTIALENCRKFTLKPA